MALRPIEPFSKDEFFADHGAAAFAEWLVEEIGQRQPDGWRQAASNYRWVGYDLDLTVEARRRQGAKLAAAGDDLDEWREACEHVREWSGNNTPFLQADLVSLRTGCEMLAAEPDGLPELFLVRAATTSKIYAARYPERWVIYDSRVALRLVGLVRRWWEEECEGLEISANCLRFPVPQGRGAVELPEGFHILGSERQARLAFFYASWLCRGVAARLQVEEQPVPANEQHWTAQLVEMTLFAR